MKLYLVSQDINNNYDTYDSMVVAAPDEETARHMLPNPDVKWPNVPEGSQVDPRGRGIKTLDNKIIKIYTDWAYTPEQVKVEYIGEAKPGTEQSVICASYNAG